MFGNFINEFAFYRFDVVCGVNLYSPDNALTCDLIVDKALSEL